ncbi:hypothetical protein IWX90DRAFT_465787 [Phyllosticta citrichinensis]|uniref:Enoyl reductase (ER) domain-containing protein n=1 Tax=Phyllosticta citrichinensis TaxID=1130410 RepID=A0ABR1XY81_9PEZI
MSETMRAIDIKNGTGPATALYINAQTPKPVPTATQALVRIKCFGLNRMDLLQREGKYPVPPQAPKTLGVEFSGTIESLGPSSEATFKVGDAVFGLAYGGAYAEYIAVSTHMLVHKPPELSFEQCAAIPETWITALQAMYLVGGFGPGQSILWHAGASSVSIAGIQLSRADGASAVYATARQDDKVRFIQEALGADKAFNTTTTDWVQGVRDASGGKGVDVIIDFVGASTFGPNLSAAARDGRIVNLGFLGGTQLDGQGVDMGAFIAKRLRYEGSSLRSRDEAYQGALRDRLVEVALPRFRSGEFTVYIERVFAFEEEQVVEAHRLMESNRTKGKLVVTIP